MCFVWSGGRDNVEEKIQKNENYGRVPTDKLIQLSLISSAHIFLLPDWSHWRILRRGRQRQVRLPNGLHGDLTLMERSRVRSPTLRQEGARKCVSRHPMGHWLPPQGPPSAPSPVRRSWRWQLGPRLLAEARGHDHSSDRLQAWLHKARFGCRWRDCGCIGCSIHCVPEVWCQICWGSAYPCKTGG